MKKIIFAVIAACYLTLASLSGSAQTIIKSTTSIGVDGIDNFLFSDHQGRPYYHRYNPVTDSLEIYKITGDYSSLLMKYKWGYGLLFSNNDAILFVSSGEAVYKVATDGSSVSILSSYSRLIPKTILGDNLVAVRDIDSQTIALSLINVNDGSISKDIVFAAGEQKNNFISSMGVVGDTLYFIIGGRYSDVLYSYNMSDGLLRVLNSSLAPYHYGVGFNNTFAYREQEGLNDFKVSFINLQNGVTNLITPKIGSSLGSTLMKGVDNEIIMISDHSIIAYNNGQSYVWNKPYAFHSLGENGKHYWIDSYWTDPDESEMLNEVKIEHDGAISILSSFDGRRLNDTEIVYGNKLYAIRIKESQLQLISIDLTCPESLTVTQSMVDAGQTYFSAKEIKISGLVNVTMPSVFEAQTMNLLPGSNLNLAHPDIKITLDVNHCPN